MGKTQTAKLKPTPGLQRACLEFTSAEAHEVFVAGSFNNWQLRETPLKPVGGGKWTIDLSLAPGRYEYRFIADGEWVDDPKAKEFAPNPLGGQNAVLVVPPLPQGGQGMHHPET